MRQAYRPASPPTVAIVIPARLASTRLPGKVLADIDGRPMLEWVWRAACRVRGAASVWVATDAPEIAEAVERFAGRAIITGSHATGTDRIAEAATQIDADAILNVQGDEPFIPPAHLDGLIAHLAADPAPMATLMTPLRNPADLHNPARVKVTARPDGRAHCFSRAPIAPEGSAATFLHIGVYLYRKPFLETFTRLAPGPLERRERLEQLRALEHGYDIALVSVDDHRAGVDTAEDLACAREAARAMRGSEIPGSP